MRRVLAREVFRGQPLPPVLYVLNKVDRLRTPEERALLARLKLEVRPQVAVSALVGTGMEHLREKLSQALARHFARVRVHLPAARAELISWLADLGQLHGVSWEDGGRAVELTLPAVWLGRLRKARLEMEEVG